MRTRFQHPEASPYHISVGVLLYNNDGKVLAHKRIPETTPEQFIYTLGGLSEVYTLMRESLEENEPLETAALRGIQEEFGATGAVEKFLGTIVGEIVPKVGDPYEKTTLYLSVRLLELGSRPTDDGEAHTELVWMEPQELLKKMEFQGKNTTRKDIDESKIVRAYLENL
jgi:ADP-ribose pyrophosphatase YjhB (NUDIX family)